MNSSQPKTLFGRLASRSLLLSALIRFSDFLRRNIAESFVGHLLGGDRRHTGDGILHYFSDKLGLRRRITVPFKRFMARHAENSLLLQQVRRLADVLPDLSLKCIGIFYFAIGLFQSVFFLIQRFALNRPVTSERELWLGAGALLLGSLLTASQARCGDAMTQSRLLSLLLVRLLGLHRENMISRGPAVGRGDAAFLFGLAAGGIGALTDPLLALLALPLLCLGYAILALPECGVVLILLVFPYGSTALVGGLTAFVALAWLLKLIRGKRTLATASLDVAVFSFALVIACGGLVSVTPVESQRAALVMLIMMLGYFVTVNLIRSSEWVSRCTTALLISLGVTATVGVAEYLLGFAPRNWLDVSMLSRIAGRSVSFFANPNVLAECLLLILPFAVTARSLSGPGDRRLGYGCLLLTAVLCLMFTWSRGGWIAAVLSLLLLLLLVSRAGFAKLFCALLCLPPLLTLLPDTVQTRLFSSFQMADSSIRYRFGIWSGVERLLSDCFAGGIGLGEAAFRRIYPLYSLAAIEAAPHTHNLYTQIAVSVGVTGLIVFLALLLILLRHVASYAAHSRNDDPALRTTVMAGFSGTVGLLLMGMTDYVWYNSRIVLLFWMVLGLTSAALRTATRERIPVRLEGPHIDLDCKRSVARLSGRKDR